MKKSDWTSREQPNTWNGITVLLLLRSLSSFSGDKIGWGGKGVTYASNTHTVCTLSAQCRALHRTVLSIELVEESNNRNQQWKKKFAHYFVLPFYSSVVPHLLISHTKKYEKEEEE